MSDPITVESCEVCKKKFNVPMTRYRKGGGWQVGDSSLHLYYQDDEIDGLSLDMVCDDCADEIIEEAIKAIKRLKKATVKPSAVKQQQGKVPQ